MSWPGLDKQGLRSYNEQVTDEPLSARESQIESRNKPERARLGYVIVIFEEYPTKTPEILQKKYPNYKKIASEPIL